MGPPRTPKLVLVQDPLLNRVGHGEEPRVHTLYSTCWFTAPTFIEASTRSAVFTSNTKPVPRYSWNPLEVILSS